VAGTVQRHRGCGSTRPSDIDSAMHGRIEVFAVRHLLHVIVEITVFLRRSARSVKVEWHVMENLSGLR
jgi:hypothetical protein